MTRFLKQSVQLLMLLSFVTLTVHAQQKPYYHHQKKSPVIARISGQGSNINVVYQRCTWRIHPDSPTVTTPAKYLRGNVATYFVTTEDNVASVTFDFNNVHNIDSVRYHGANLTLANITWNSSKILQLNFPAAIATSGTLDSVTIFYKGTPPAVSGNQLGYQKAKSGSNNYVYTLSESYEDRDWWPCKHDMTDKIDSLDIIVSVPSAFRVASNGKMTDSAISGSSRIYKFKHRYPIASYLVSLAVAKYNVYHRGTVNINGTNVPVVYNLFTGKTNSTYNNILNAMDKSKLELVQFSNKYGDYPFKNEKHGYYEFGFGGGMEHQTFSGMGGSGLTSWSIIAHELAHQWFGDKVTCATWSDLWLNEGFARYNEVVAAELVAGLGNPVTHRGSIKTIARNNTTTPIFISNISSSNTIWTSSNVSAIYDRAAMVISQLRKLLGDTKFFQACRNYIDDPIITYGAATTADAKRNFEAQFGADMSAYFNAWIYGNGTPTYVLNWNNSANNITLQLNQTRSTGASVSYFPIPVVIRVSNAGNTTNTTLVLYDRGDSVFVAGDGIGSGVAGNTIQLSLAFTPATVSFDPNNETMATGTVTKVSTLRLSAPAQPTWVSSGISVSPNPASQEINVSRNENSAEGILFIVDMHGKQLLKKNIGKRASDRINIGQLPSGIYSVQLFENGVLSETAKLVVEK